MAKTEIGARVGAILSADQNEVRLLGYGVYDRDERVCLAAGLHLPTPHITLDDGTEVLGAQCWWGPEDKIKDMIGARQVVLVDLDGNPKVTA